MNRKRQSNRGLPARVYIKDGAYRFLAPEKIRDPADGKLKFWIRLAGLGNGPGCGEAAMLSALGKLRGEQQMDRAGMPYLCQEFKAHRLKGYSDETIAQYSGYLDAIAHDFQDFQVRDVQTRHWYEFLRNNYEGKANSAKKITALGVKLFKFGISRFGLREDNPLDQLDMTEYRTKRRTVIPTREQVAAIRAAALVGKDGRKTLSGPTLVCIIDISYLCWQRAKEFRMLEESQIVDGKIRFKPTKTEKSSGLSVDIIITPEIQAVLDRARAIKREHGIVSRYVFCKLSKADGGRLTGTAYTKNGLFSMWDRARERAKIVDDVQFKDLRALGATDAAKGGLSKQSIQDRLVHADAGTTDIYIKEAVPAVSEIAMKLPW